ncbi:MAG: hypothetical protein A2283_06430 [Lentisphaerae bacterium RIFOXYA12_FULL_48_11]|nr:MAG: hypothetical protein A2283_06430 [Lentisphaerae bacterium RIFOXYA12_FULL_48_11]
MIHKPRRWDAVCEDDPSAGLLNLFDVWIAFSVALLLALFGYLQNSAPMSHSSNDAGSTPALEELLQSIKKAPHFRPTNAPLTGEGTRLGTAYRLQTGEVVYVPD